MVDMRKEWRKKERRQDMGEGPQKVSKRQNKKGWRKGVGKTKMRKVRKEKYRGRKKTLNLLLETYRISCEMRSVEAREIAQEIVE
jgi:hypothetical protein